MRFNHGVSSELVVWAAALATSTNAACELYDAIYAGGRELASEPALVSFRRELTALWPELTAESEKERSSPWSAGFDVSDAHLVLCIRPERADEIGAVVRQIAAMHGLAVFDPRYGRLWLPPTDAMTLDEEATLATGGLHPGDVPRFRVVKRWGSAYPIAVRGMPLASVTFRKGAVTLPDSVKNLLGLLPGDRVEFRLRDDGSVVLEAATLDPMSLRGVVKPPTRGVTPRHMNVVIRRAIERR